ncbi:putative EAL domain-containing protein [Alphaproteobacteria bacterium]
MSVQESKIDTSIFDCFLGKLVRGARRSVLVCDTDKCIFIAMHVGSLPLIRDGYSDALYSHATNFIAKMLSDTISFPYLLQKILYDTFILVLPLQRDVSRKQCSKNIFHILENCGKSLAKLRDDHIYLDIKLGYTVGHRDESTLNLVQKACFALKECHRDNQQYHKYTKKQNAKSTASFLKTAELAKILEHAILSNRTKLAFQPIIEAKNGKPIRYEGLLRIVTLDGKVISAGRHILAAEKLGFIVEVDIMVLKSAVQELVLHISLQLSINISYNSVSNYKWLDEAKRLLVDDVIASRLTIEITETTFYHDIKKVRHFIKIIQSLGCKVAIDDFGSGYTSFNLLRNLKVDMVKIDGSYIKKLSKNENYYMFVATLTKFARTLNLRTVAEFVEDADTAKKLMTLGVDYLQGNYFAPAMSHRSWLRHLEKHFSK